MFKKSTKRYTDEQLLTGLRLDPKARSTWDARFFRQFSVLIWKRSRRYGLTDEEAGDAYTDAVVAFFQQLHKGTFRGESSIYTYLNRIFINKCIDFSRKKSTNVLHHTQEESWDLEDEGQDFFKKIVDRERVDKLRSALGKLGKRCRELLLLVGKGYKTAEIAKEMNFSTPQSAASQKFQCKQKLMQQFSQPTSD